jgi:cbb3-type cytochrome oxidase subunit 3
MLAYFYSSDGGMIFVILFLPFFLIAIFGGCVGVIYRVFRDDRKRESDYKMIKESSPGLSLVGVLFSLIVAAVSIIGNHFDSELLASRFYLLSTIIAALTLLLGIFALPRWQGFAAIFNFFFVCIVALILLG